MQSPKLGVGQNPWFLESNPLQIQCSIASRSFMLIQAMRLLVTFGLYKAELPPSVHINKACMLILQLYTAG